MEKLKASISFISLVPWFKNIDVKIEFILINDAEGNRFSQALTYVTSSFSARLFASAQLINPVLITNALLIVAYSFAYY